MVSIISDRHAITLTLNTALSGVPKGPCAETTDDPCGSVS